MIKYLKLAVVFSAALVLFGLSSQEAQAYSCSNATYGSGSGLYNGTYADCSANNTANQSSTVATSTAVLKTAASQNARMVSDRVSAAVSGDGGVSMAASGFSASTGMAAGNGTSGFGAWVSGAWSDVEDENTDTAFDGDVYSALAGVDYRVAPRTVIGIAIGYENVDLDTAYNGFGGADGNLDADGWTIAPYIGAELAPNVSATLTAGYSEIEYDTLRFDPNSGNRITGSTDADRYFVSASVRGMHEFDQNWRLHGQGGVFYADEDKDAFTETESNGAAIANASQDTSFGQVTVDARLGYLMQGFEPYALAGVEWDFSKDEAPVAVGQSRASLDDEDFGAKFGGGVKLHLAPNVTGGLELYTVEFRDDYSEYTLTGGLNVKF